ncbi:MAG: hypothetical protein ACR2N3_03960 [Pyrinomonadaceae bacterium]
MFRVLLILILLSASVFAQTQEKLKTYKFFEYEKISNNLLKEKLENFRLEVMKSKNSQGQIINYGKPSEVAKAEKQLKKNMFNCGYAGCYWLTFINGGVSKKGKTELWIVPEGAEPPMPN